jgi:hypothetical protein
MTGRYLSRGPRFLLAAVGVFLPLLAAGCGPAVGDISGKVTYKGETLGSGTVMFYGTNSATPASIGDDGTYTAKKVPVGPMKITVETSPPAGGGKGGPASLNQGTMIVDGQPVPPPGKYVEIPNKYKDAKASGLTLDVKAGKQQHDIPLE